MVDSANNIIEDYLEICKVYKKKSLTREEYRADGNYSTTLIESMWGSWTAFVCAVNKEEYLGRKQIAKESSNNKVVITHVYDGSKINYDCLKTLKKYCEVEKADLFILWGKPITKDAIFDKKDYDLLIDNLCTSVLLEKDKNLVICDALVTPTQVNPLVNVDKWCGTRESVILGSSKQYMKVLPYKRLEKMHLCYTTGTISDIDYGEKMSDKLNEKYHTYGALVLEFDKDTKSYKMRNLIYKDKKICDLRKKYTSSKVTENNPVRAMILGDLHFPAEDTKAIEKTKESIRKLKPELVVLHDVGDFLSINHHNEHQYLSRQMYVDDKTCSLAVEMNEIFTKLKDLTKEFKNTEFYITSSNHDDFIKKWLDEGEYPKDRVNAEIGNRLYLHYLKGGEIFDLAECKNVHKARRDETLEISKYQLLEHGDGGIGGGRGNTATYTRMFDKAVVGHTHSPEIFQSTIHVGTLSKLDMVYNTKGGTTWAHANVIIHENETFQMLFV